MLPKRMPKGEAEVEFDRMMRSHRPSVRPPPPCARISTPAIFTHNFALPLGTHAKDTGASDDNALAKGAPSKDGMTVLACFAQVQGQSVTVFTRGDKGEKLYVGLPDRQPIEFGGS